MREPAKKNMYKGVSAAYGVIVLSYWQLAFTGYWAFGSHVQPYILSSLTVPQWTIVMANLFAVIQISGCFQVPLILRVICSNLALGRGNSRVKSFLTRVFLCPNSKFISFLSGRSVNPQHTIFHNLGFSSDAVFAFHVVRYIAGQHMPTLMRDSCHTKPPAPVISGSEKP